MMGFPWALCRGRITDGLLAAAGGKILFVIANALHCRPANSRAMQAPLLLLDAVMRLWSLLCKNRKLYFHTVRLLKTQL